jgi:U4/U6.U5 tri-snRNP-associated protein 1
MGRRDDDEREDGEADGAPETAFPEGIDAKTTEAGGEVSMSLEETNRVREKLGLKPLRVGESDRAKRQREAEQAAHAARRDAEKSKETAEIAARIAAAKERRQMDARNRATAQLGEADDAEDDLSAWVSKSRDIELKEKLEAKRKAEELARKLAEQDDDFEDSESDDDGETRPKKSLGDMYTSEALAGLRVRHGADEVAEGETVVLTLKDSSILDETRTGVNDEGDELENVLLAEEKRRKRARAEATKRPANPFAEEDENDKTLLGKYDEKKEEDTLTLNDAGAVSAAEEARKAEIRRRLAASLGGAPAGAEEQSAATEKKTLAEFLTPAEVEAREAAAAAAKFNRPKKKRRKKLREKKLDVDELEGDALVPAASELGSRRRREEEGSAADAAAATDRWRREAHFAAALTKAKRRTDERILAEMAGEEEEENLEEEDDELERALARSRTAAAAAEKKSGGVDAVVAAVAERRLKDEALPGGVDGAASAGGVVFSDMQEFVQGIDGGAREDGDETGDAMDAAEDEEMPPAPPPPPPGAEADADSDGAMPPPPPPPPTAVPPPAPVERVNLGGIGEASTASKGLAATLALLKDTGKLHETEMWDGRTNDKKPLALQRAREAAALPSGEHEGKKFDFNLDKYDEFGRKMTPKEAFRDLCHKFHGIEPSKNKKDKRLRQYQEEMKQKKLAEKLAEEGAVGSMESMKRVQQVSHSPFLMLDGKLRAGQSSHAEGGFAARDEEDGAKSAGAAGNKKPAASKLGAVGGAAKVAFQMSKPKQR